MTAAAEEKGEARTHNSGGSTHAKEAFTAQLTMNCIGSRAHTKVVSRAQGKNHWSFRGRSWKPRARDMFTAPSWGIKEADIEMGATIYRRTRAERWGESHTQAGTYSSPNPRPTGRGTPPPPPGGGGGYGWTAGRTPAAGEDLWSSEPYS